MTKLMRPAPVKILAMIVILGCASFGSTLAAAQTITEFAVPTPNSESQFITAGPDGAMWFTETAANQVGRISLSASGVATINEFPVDVPNAKPAGIAAAPDGRLWAAGFSPNGSNGAPIPTVTTAGHVFSIEEAFFENRQFFGIAEGPDGNMWLTDLLGNAIVAVRPSDGLASATPIPTSGSMPAGIALGPDNALWFTENRGNRIGRTTGGAATEFVIPTSASGPEWIVPGPDGAMWFTEINGNQIGRISTSASPDAPGITEFPLPAGSVPVGIAVGSDGALWFTEQGSNKIGRLTTSGSFSEIAIPTANSGAEFIATGPDGSLWFMEGGANKIGHIVPPANASKLFAAVLPTSRSIQVGHVATVFATLINTGPTSPNCGIAPITPLPADFAFQTTDPATNQLNGFPNSRVVIPAGSAQTFFLSFAANGTIGSTDVMLGFDCTGNDAAAIGFGIDTVLLSFDANPVPDVIALAATISNDGIVDIPGASATGAFAVATSNVGAAATLTVSADTGEATLPIFTGICQTNPANGQCNGPPADSITLPIAANATPTFSIFVFGTGTVPFDPAGSRVFVRFRDSSGVVRGSTSVAVRTQ